MRVLLSIRPEFSEKIFSGEKKYEYRKRIYKNTSVDTVVVYATLPTAKIVGQFRVRGILSADPISLWSKTKDYSGITRRYFDEYFAGRDVGHALQIGDIIQYKEPISAYELDNFVAPQSFKYLTPAHQGYWPNEIAA